MLDGKDRVKGSAAALAARLLAGAVVLSAACKASAALGCGVAVFGWEAVAVDLDTAAPEVLASNAGMAKGLLVAMPWNRSKGLLGGTVDGEGAKLG